MILSQCYHTCLLITWLDALIFWNGYFFYRWMLARTDCDIEALDFSFPTLRLWWSPWVFTPGPPATTPPTTARCHGDGPHSPVVTSVASRGGIHWGATSCLPAQRLAVALVLLWVSAEVASLGRGRGKMGELERRRSRLRICFMYTIFIHYCCLHLCIQSQYIVEFVS